MQRMESNASYYSLKTVWLKPPDGKKGDDPRAVWPDKIAKCLQNMPKYDFTRKTDDFDTLTTIA